MSNVPRSPLDAKKKDENTIHLCLIPCHLQQVLWLKKCNTGRVTSSSSKVIFHSASSVQMQSNTSWSWFSPWRFIHNRDNIFLLFLYRLGFLSRTYHNKCGLTPWASSIRPLPEFAVNDAWTACKYIYVVPHPSLPSLLGETGVFCGRNLKSAFNIEIFWYLLNFSHSCVPLYTQGEIEAKFTELLY